MLSVYCIATDEIKLLIVSEKKQTECFFWEQEDYYWEANVLSLMPDNVNNYSLNNVIKKTKKLSFFRIFHPMLYVLGSGNDYFNSQAICDLWIIDNRGKIKTAISSPDSSGFDWDSVNVTEKNGKLLINSIKCFDFQKREYRILSYDVNEKITFPCNVVDWIENSDRYNCKIHTDGKIEVVSFGLANNFLSYLMPESIVANNHLSSGYWFSIFNNDKHQIFLYNSPEQNNESPKKLLVYDKVQKKENIAEYSADFRIHNFCCNYIIFNHVAQGEDINISFTLIYNYLENKFLQLKLPTNGKLLCIYNDLFFVSYADNIIIIKQTNDNFTKIKEIPFKDTIRIAGCVILNH